MEELERSTLLPSDDAKPLHGLPREVVTSDRRWRYFSLATVTALVASSCVYYSHRRRATRATALVENPEPLSSPPGSELQTDTWMDQTKGYDKYSVNLSSSSTVRDWISSRASGASLLPEAIDIYIDTERVQSNMGQQAQEGFVAMNLA